MTIQVQKTIHRFMKVTQIQNQKLTSFHEVGELTQAETGVA